MKEKGLLEKVKQVLCSKECGITLNLSNVDAILSMIIEILKKNNGEINLPDEEIEALARAFLPEILAFFSSPEGKTEFEKWQKDQAEKEKKNEGEESA